MIFEKGQLVKYIGTRIDLNGSKARVIRHKKNDIVTIDWINEMPGTLNLGYFDAKAVNLIALTELTGSAFMSRVGRVVYRFDADS